MNMDKENAQEQIRDLIEARVRAVDAKDIETLMANHAPDVLSFDVVNDLQVHGADAVRARALSWFASYPGRIGYEVRDLRITAGTEVAFCTYLYHVTGTLQDGGGGARAPQDPLGHDHGLLIPGTPIVCFPERRKVPPC